MLLMSSGREPNRTPDAAARHFRVLFRAIAATTAKSVTNTTTAISRKYLTSTLFLPKHEAYQISITRLDIITPTTELPVSSGRKTVPECSSFLDSHSSPVVASASPSHSTDGFIQIRCGNGNSAAGPLTSLHCPFQQTCHSIDIDHLEVSPFYLAADGTHSEKRVPSASGGSLSIPLALRSQARTSRHVL